MILTVLSIYAITTVIKACVDECGLIHISGKHFELEAFSSPMTSETIQPFEILLHRSVKSQLW